MMGVIMDKSLYSLAWVERKPTVLQMVKTFPERLASVRAALDPTVETTYADKQLLKVKRCEESYDRTNGKTFYNLFLASAKLHNMLLALEHRARFAGDCANCGHGKHMAGNCVACNCGESEIVHGH